MKNSEFKRLEAIYKEFMQRCDALQDLIRENQKTPKNV
jgi:hypothetical protein